MFLPVAASSAAETGGQVRIGAVQRGSGWENWNASRIEFASCSRAAEDGHAEVLVDELEHGREVVGRVVDAALRPRRDDQHGDADAEPEPVRLRRRDVVVEPAALVPGEHDGRVAPVRQAHDPVDQVGGPVLALAQRGAAGVVAARCTAGRSR